MNLAAVDWLIVFFVLGIMVAGVLLSRREMRGVSDVLAAGRSAGRDLLCVAGGIAGLGAISIVRDVEMNYIAGFSLSWWGLTMSVVVVVVTVSGWVIYRFRRTRCLTLAEFFERRYSRRFRIFAGIIVFGAGTLNFGIFPSVGARFFIHYCGIAREFTVLGLTVPTFPVLMAGLLSISLFFVFAGGQIVVIITDFLQGLFVNVVFLLLVLYLLTVVSWDQLFETLGKAPAKASLTNPFDTQNIPDFNLWFFLIGVVGFLYTAMSWQGTQAYNVSAKSAHEAKMGGVLGMWRGFPQGLFILLVPMLMYTVMNHVDFASTAERVGERLSGIGAGLTEKQQSTLNGQMRVPLVLAEVLPAGLLGAFAAVMLAAFISTHDTYLHSWGSVFVQDVVMPLRKKPLNPEQHLRLLRFAIVGVAVVIFVWSLIFHLSEQIAFYFAVTGAIFAGGSGAVIIGGLYTRWGKTSAAWAALITGSSLALGRILLHQFLPEESLAGIGGGNLGLAFIGFYALDGQWVWLVTMGTATVLYVGLSFLGRRERFDLDKLLRRGEHEVPGETEIVNANPGRGWRLLGMGREFTRGDRALYLATYIWNGLWLVVFIVGTVINLTNAVEDSSWVTYWKTYLTIHMGMSVVVIVWFSIGGAFDLRSMIRSLRARTRDDADDGFVRREEP